MSTSVVYNPLGSRFATRAPDRLGGQRRDAAVRKVSRVLFGPVDRAETHRFIEEELTKIRVSQSELWNFDFRRERQLDPEGAYEWRPATPPPQPPPPTSRYVLRGRVAAPPSSPQLPPPRLVDAQDALYHQESMPEAARPRGGGKSPRPQRLITDFLKKKKKSSSDYVKKDWPSAVERPAKLPRLSDMS